MEFGVNKNPDFSEFIAGPIIGRNSGLSPNKSIAK